MATVVTQPERLVILDRVSWDTYERLITEHGERSGTRFTYDEGGTPDYGGFFSSRKAQSNASDACRSIG